MIAFALAGAGLASGGDSLEEIVVEEEAPPPTATSRSLDRAQLVAFPAGSADELLRAMPGLHLAAHGGNGKAFQFLVRGFDAEHGADLAVSVEGVPLNEVSNVHGQGYLDLHFLPMAVVDGLDLVKGSYQASDGDFATTGSVEYHVGRAVDGASATVGAGTDRSGVAALVWRPRGEQPGDFVVAETEGARGVGDGRDYLQARLAAGLERPFGAATLRAMAFAYHGSFASPGLVRADDLADGSMDLYDAYDVPQGGVSERLLGLVRLDAAGAAGGLHGLLYAGARALSLDQNFTGFLADPVHGDGTRQSETAAQAGVRLRGERVLTVLQETWAARAGLDVRGDALSVAEGGLDLDGEVWQPRIDARIRQIDVGAWAELRARLAGRIDLVPGVRVDQLALGHLALRDPAFAEIEDPVWQWSSATVGSPKATATVHTWRPLDLFAAWGRGFRSPDARGIADGDRAPVMRSTSAEAGFRLAPDERTAVQAAVFEIRIDNELVFDHVSARFLSAGRTVRNGVELVAEQQLAPHVRFQGDVTYTDGRFDATGEPIPYAPRWLLAGGVYAEGRPLGSTLLTGGLRVWYLGRRPLPSGFASSPALVGALTARLDWRSVAFALDIDDLLHLRPIDGEFVYPSWFDRSEPRSELKTLHVSAGKPFAARAAVSIRF